MDVLAADYTYLPTGATKVYGILGDPVTHSLSPAMQNAAFHALRLNNIYLPFPTKPQHFATVVQGLGLGGVGGFNLTIPHKMHILPLLQQMHPQAKRIGAVNTVRARITQQGTLHLEGCNTDATGLLNALREDLNFVPKASRVLLLGAGGAACAAAFALVGGGCAHLVIANRSVARAQALQQACQPHAPANTLISACPLAGLPVQALDLVLNATSVGMGDGRSPLDLSQIPSPKAVMDMVYAPRETPLLSQAKALGIPHANGLGMLLHQGAQAFTYWTGHPAPLEAMRKALLQNLAT